VNSRIAEIADAMQSHIDVYNTPGGPDAQHTIERLETLVAELKKENAPEPSWQDMPTVTWQNKLMVHLELTKQGGMTHLADHLIQKHSLLPGEIADRPMDDLLRKHAELEQATPPLATPMVSCFNGEHLDGIHQLTYACRAPKFANHPQGEL
jgi:hypothetical protein